MLPLVLVIACGVFILPFMPILLFTRPSLESLFVVLLMVGLWPMSVAVSHSAFFVEHFIGRSMPKGASDKYDMFDGYYLMYVRLALGAGEFLSRALDDYGETLNEETLLRGRRLVNQQKFIKKFVWPGFVLTVIGAVGLTAIQVLEIPPGT